MRLIKSVIFSLTACFVIIGCTTSKYVSSGVPIRENYSFGYIEDIMDYGGSPQLYSMHLEIFQLIEQTGIKMLGEGEIENLSDSDKQHLLAIKYAVSSSSFESVVTISFFDYITKRPLLNCTGASSWGLPSIDIPGCCLPG